MGDLALRGIDHAAHEQQAICAVFVDQEQERVVHHEADLRGKGHEAHLGQSCCLCAFLIHCDGALVFQLDRDTERGWSDTVSGFKRLEEAVGSSKRPSEACTTLVF